MRRVHARDLCPPLVWSAAKKTRAAWRRRRSTFSDNTFSADTFSANGDHQDLAVYSDPEFARILEHWGDDNVWVEIQLLLWSYRGRVLDIACGSGRAIELLHRFPDLEVHGCDIAPLLIDEAAKRGISRERLRVCDATETGYPSQHFEYSYSIGSLEHFTIDGIHGFLDEARRVTRVASLHQIPVSRSGADEGWTRDSYQSFHNNSVPWWLEHFSAAFPTVHTIDSVWEGGDSVGRWFICLT